VFHENRGGFQKNFQGFSRNWPCLDQDTLIEQSVRLRYSNRALSDSDHGSIVSYEGWDKDSYMVYQ